uniref:Uncharacterized protein n=1 Tax=Cacopsylla melanoneura TaxID=428564 RepID=A0A8D8V555_9HEMI
MTAKCSHEVLYTLTWTDCMWFPGPMRVIAPLIDSGLLRMVILSCDSAVYGFWKKGVLLHPGAICAAGIVSRGVTLVTRRGTMNTRGGSLGRVDPCEDIALLYREYTVLRRPIMVVQALIGTLLQCLGTYTYYTLFLFIKN